MADGRKTVVWLDDDACSIHPVIVIHSPLLNHGETVTQWNTVFETS
jgi:hypothetical protein